MASDLGDVLRAAPVLKKAPGLALSVAQYGGPVTENAQQVAGVAKSRSLEQGPERLSRDVGPERDVLAPKPSGGGGWLGDVTGAISSGIHTASNAVGGVEHAVVHNVESIPGAIGQVASGAGKSVSNQIANSPLMRKGGIADQQAQAQAAGVGLTGQLEGAGTGSVKSFGQEVGQQANAIVTYPAHTYRMLYDINARQGPAAAFEAAIPLLGGAVLGALATRSPEGAVSGEEAAAGAIGDSADVAPELTAAQRTGQMAKTVTKGVLKPPVVAGKAVAGAINTVATSPAALGGELGQEAALKLSPHSLQASAWQRTADASTWKLPDGKIGPTFGQAVAGGVGLKPGASAFNALSGVLDAFTYVAAPDPLGAAGRVVGKARSAEGFGESFLGRHVAGGTAGITPSGVESAITQNPTIKMAMRDITGMDSAGQIAQKYPLFAPIADRLAKTTSFDGTAQIFKDVARTQELHTTSGLPELGPATASRALGRRVTGLVTPAPTTFDEEAQHFVGRTMKVGSDTMVPAVMHMLSGAGEDRAVVHQVGTDLAGISDPRLQALTIRNAMKDYVGSEIVRILPKRAGIASEDDFKTSVTNAMSDAIDNMFGGEGAGHVGQFGRDSAGGDLSRVYTNPDDPQEASRAAALWFNQADEFKIPSLRDVRQTVLDLAQMEKWTAKNGVLSRGLSFEQFIDHTINEKIFQPLALATMGWATRVSISEVAMNALRQGPLNFTAARIAASAAKQNWAMNSTEIGHFMQAIHGTLAGIDESVVKGLGKDRLLDAAVASNQMFGGSVVSPALDGTHAPLMRGTDQPDIAAADTRSYLRRKGILPGQISIKNVPLSDNFTQLAPGASGYYRSMSEVAGRIAHDKLGEVVAQAYHGGLEAGMNERDASALAVTQAKRFLDNLPESEVSHMTRHFATSRDGAGIDPHQDWAVQAVKALKGSVTGADGTLHRDLLRDIVDKTVPDVKGMAARYGSADPASLPYTFGREVQLKTADVIQRASNSLHSRVLGPVVNALSREPTWVVDFAQERKLLEKGVKSGEMDQDAADALAATRAAYKSIRFVHNPLDRTKIENMLHTFAPFYFAQNQALRRAGRLFSTNPGAFEQYMKLMLGLNNVAHQVTLKNGLPTFIIPGSTISGQGITGALSGLGITPKGSIPIGLTGAADVSTTIDPFSSADTSSGTKANPLSELTSALKPSFGPVVSIPAKMITDLFGSKEPILAEIANKALGPVASNEPLWMQFVPNSILQHAAEGIEGLKSQGQDSFGASYTSAFLGLMAAYAENGDLPDPASLAGNDPQSKAAFIRKVNNATFALWMGRTLVAGTSPISVALGRANLAFSNMATDYINKAGGNVSKGLDAMTRAHPNLVPSEVFQSQASGGYAFPETDKAQEWITEHQGVVNKYPTASRWILPNTDATGKFSYNAYTFELAHGLRTKDTPSQFFDQIYISSGNSYYYDVIKPEMDKAIAEKPGDKSWAYQVYTKGDEALQKYGTNLNPIWLQNWNADNSKSLKGEAVAQMTQMLADPQTPKSPLTEHIGFIINVYNQFQGEKTQGHMTSAQLKAQWAAIMDEAIKKYPDTQPVVQGVFLGLG